jgi:hypothetical protein
MTQIATTRILNGRLTRLQSPARNVAFVVTNPANGKDYYLLLDDIIESDGTYPQWIAPTDGETDTYYQTDDRVEFGLKFWKSLVDDNQAVPSEGASWTEVSAPAGDGASQSWVEARPWKFWAHCASTGNLVLSGIQTIDGVAGAAGQIALAMHQTDKKENGWYLMSSGAWVRCTFADESDKFIGAIGYVVQGTVNGKKHFKQVTYPVTLGTSNIVFENIMDELFKGYYTSTANLNAAYPTATKGSYAIVDTGTSVDGKVYIWDNDDNVWVLSSGTAVVMASETVNGTVEEATDGEMQAGTATGGTGAKLFSTPAKLATWWTWLKTQAQTFANLTATVFKIGGQAATAGTYRILYIDENGQVFKEQNFGIDPTNKRLQLKAVNNLAAGYTLQIVDSSDTMVLKVNNDGSTEFGGTSAFLTVPSTIPDGSAGIIVRTALDIAYRVKDESSFDFLKAKSSTTGIGRALYLSQNQVNDYGKGFETIRKQAKIITSSTTSAQNTIDTIAIPSGFGIALHVHNAMAFATNGNIQSCGPFASLGYNNAGTTSGTTGTINALRITATDGNFNINYNDTTDELEIRFQNESGTGRTYDVVVDYSYILYALPV